MERAHKSSFMVITEEGRQFISQSQQAEMYIAAEKRIANPL